MLPAAAGSTFSKKYRKFKKRAMASEEETRKNGDLRKVANAMHTRVSEFCHLFEKTLPAAAGSIILPNVRLQILPKTVGQTINPVHLASFWSRHPLQKPFWSPSEIALPCLTCAHLLLGDPIFEPVVHIMLGSFCRTALFIVGFSFFIHMF